MTSEELFFDALKSHRKSKSIEISEICEFTKINPRYIEAIESGDFSILPNVYMRLFLRAYADFIGADSSKTLEDFEFHTMGKIQKKTTIKIQPADELANTVGAGDSLASSPQIPPKQIVTGATVIIGLIVVFYWAGQITNQQKSVVENKYNFIGDPWWYGRPLWVERLLNAFLKYYYRL